MRPRSLAGAGCIIAVALSLLATPAVAAPRLDARFGDGGVARAPLKFPGFREFLAGALRPVRQADGKVIVAAQPDVDRGQSNEVFLARFGRAGALDTTFGRRGRLRLSFPWQFRPLTVLSQRDGRIVLVGTVGGYAYFSATPSQLGIVRLLPDGSRDRSFGTNGFVVWNPPWRTTNEWTTPGLALLQPDGRLLVAASVEDPRSQGSPDPARWRQRVVLVRFQPDGSLDQSLGQGGFAELDSEKPGYFGPWARLADGRLATVVSRHEGEPTYESQAWWLHSFTADGSSAVPLRSTGSVRLGLDVLDQLVDLVPTRDGGLLMIGDFEHERGPATAVRRILPDGSLDATYGRKCGRPALWARSRGGAATRDGGVLVTASTLLIHARPRRFDSFAINRDAAGCIAARPLRLRGLIAGPPLLQRGRSALLGATSNHGLALIKIRR